MAARNESGNVVRSILARSVLQAAATAATQVARDVFDAATAARAGVDRGLPQLTPVDVSLPKLNSSKTNPTPPQPPPQRPPVHSRETTDRPAARFAPRDDSAILRNEPKVDAGLPELTPAEELSPRQLAGARLLASGHSTADVARALRITRQAVWKWTRITAFREEVKTLHRLMALGR
jgi:hypothetical protein